MNICKAPTDLRTQCPQEIFINDFCLHHYKNHKKLYQRYKIVEKKYKYLFSNIFDYEPKNLPETIKAINLVSRVVTRRQEHLNTCYMPEFQDEGHLLRIVYLNAKLRQLYGYYDKFLVLPVQETKEEKRENKFESLEEEIPVFSESIPEIKPKYKIYQEQLEPITDDEFLALYKELHQLEKEQLKIEFNEYDYIYRYIYKYLRKSGENFNDESIKFTILTLYDIFILYDYFMIRERKENTLEIGDLTIILDQNKQLMPMEKSRPNKCENCTHIHYDHEVPQFKKRISEDFETDNFAEIVYLIHQHNNCDCIDFEIKIINSIFFVYKPKSFFIGNIFIYKKEMWMSIYLEADKLINYNDISEINKFKKNIERMEHLSNFLPEEQQIYNYDKFKKGLPIYTKDKKYVRKANLCFNDDYHTRVIPNSDVFLLEQINTQMEKRLAGTSLLEHIKENSSFINYGILEKV